MRKWIDIVEAALSADLLRKISPNTEQGRKNAETIERLQAEIDAEETRNLSSVPAHLRRFDADSDDWAEEMSWLDYELEQKKKKALERTRRQQRQQQDEWQAKLDGYTQAGRDEYESYLAKAKEFVSKKADKHTSAMEKQRRAIAVMAQRQLKK